MKVHHFLRTAFVAAGCCLAGCQSWQGAGFPVQNATRVPPPGTGTYQLPSGYYNNSSSSSALPNSTSQLHAANATTGIRPVSAAAPGTQMPATNLTASSAVVAATYSDPNQNIQAVQAPFTQMRQEFTESPTASGSGASDSTGAAGNANPSNSVDVPSLQWQQFGDQ